MPVFFNRLLFALLLALPGSVLAHPALWVVKDADTTIYLFGTVHLLPKGTAWRYPALNHALADSQMLYVEVADDDPAHMTALVLRYGIDTAHPLSQQLTPFDRGRLERAARLAQVPGGMAALDLMRPWLASLTLNVTPLLKAGLDPTLGADKQLRETMTRAGKPVRGLETAEEQVRFLADLPTAQQLALLRASLRDDKHARISLKAILDAWLAGDEAGLANIENRQLKQQEPRLYQRLVVERNARWASRIKALLGTPGTVFIAVGAAHLAGVDSVQAQLARLGIISVRE